MIEQTFELATMYEAKRYELRNNFNDDVHIVTMAMIRDAFKEDEVELIRILNNTSSKWYIHEIFS